jgi:predicted adenylyl cyclase CyaB
MPRNIEIKAYIESVEALTPKVAMLADQGPIEIVQDDIFFSCESGRLKLRIFSATEGELIFYRRADREGPKESSYFRSSTSDPESLRQVLCLAYGQSGRVRKRRTLYLIGRTRIHLDRVENLGDFLELEVVLAEDEPGEIGIREALSLMTKLGIEPFQCINKAYVDLGVQRSTPSTQPPD